MQSVSAWNYLYAWLGCEHRREYYSTVPISTRKLIINVLVLRLINIVKVKQWRVLSDQYLVNIATKLVIHLEFMK